MAHSAQRKIQFQYQPTCIFWTWGHKCDVWVCTLPSKNIKHMRTWPGSLYQSSSWSRSGWAFLRLISAMTSKTSESELLEQVLSSSDSHSDSLELSNRGEGETRREAEDIHKMVTLGDFPMTQTSQCKDSCLSFQQIFECQALCSAIPWKVIQPIMLSHDLAGKANKDFYRERLGAGENASHSSMGLHILKGAAIQTRASPWSGKVTGGFWNGCTPPRQGGGVGGWGGSKRKGTEGALHAKACRREHRDTGCSKGPAETSWEVRVEGSWLPDGWLWRPDSSLNAFSQ